MAVHIKNERLTWNKYIAYASDIVIVVCLFAAAGAWPTPDVNEAHYLTRARHDFDPSWAEHDFFLNTPEAHGLFALVIGPLAAWFPLWMAAWIGRVAGWIALSLGFLHVARGVLEQRYAHLLAAALFSLGLRYTTAAGEWMIGGCEAKVFAWAGVLFAVGEIVRDRWSSAWLILSFSTAIHPLVGGWGMIACIVEQCFLSRKIRLSMLPFMAGIFIAMVGLVPALMLSFGADHAIRLEANRIYVTERLPHHLLPRTFASGMIPRHFLAAFVSWLLAKYLPDDKSRQRLQGYALSALFISLLGYGIAWLEAFDSGIAYGLLKYYWFRLSDGLTPLALALVVAACFNQSQVIKKLFGSVVIARWAIMLLLALDLVNESRHWPLMGRDVRPRSDKFLHVDAWHDVCEWSSKHTSQEACFIVPRRASTFVWNTGRAEVVSWKNIPQASESIIEWRQRIVHCFSRDGTLRNMETDAAVLGRKHLIDIAQKYGADHAIAAADIQDLDGPGLKRLYVNDSYAVYRLEL